MKRNPVKRNMDKFHKPKVHRDKSKYIRSNTWAPEETWMRMEKEVKEME